MYTLLIDCEGDSESVREWLRDRCEGSSDLVVVDRDEIAVQLMRSDAPPSLVVRAGRQGLDTSPLVEPGGETIRPSPPVVIICPSGELDTDGVQAALGTAQVVAPASQSDFNSTLDGIVTVAETAVALDFTSEKRPPRLHHGVFIGESPAMHRVYKMLEKVAKTGTTCLVTGESGTGKELVAEVLHSLSERPGNLVPVNCGAIPENLLESEFFGHKKGAFTGAISDHKGRFAMANLGTLFLDEIGEMQPSLQVKLLRALQTGEVQPVGSRSNVKVDVRVVAATNRDLEVEMREGNFREDLYYRLAIVPIEMPALRERKGDIPLLVRYVVGRINKTAFEPVRGITSAALNALCNYEWPGNVRELSAVLERMVVLAEAETLTVEDLPPKLAHVVPEPVEETAEAPAVAYRELDLPDDGLELGVAVDRYETILILQALERTGWNKNQAAQLLNMNRTTLVEKLKKKQLTADNAGETLTALQAVEVGE